MRLTSCICDATKGVVGSSPDIFSLCASLPLPITCHFSFLVGHLKLCWPLAAGYVSTKPKVTMPFATDNPILSSYSFYSTRSLPQASRVYSCCYPRCMACLVVRFLFFEPIVSLEPTAFEVNAGYSNSYMSVVGNIQLGL